MSVKIYHNPRCSKSREGLKTLELITSEFEIIRYLDDVPSVGEIEEILDMLDMDAIDLVRTKESIWKENFKDKELSEEEIILAMAEFPKLIERPIVINGEKAVIARPADKIKELF
jgi:arsenate reductase